MSVVRICNYSIQEEGLPVSDTGLFSCLDSIALDMILTVSQVNEVVIGVRPKLSYLREHRWLQLSNTDIYSPFVYFPSRPLMSAFGR